MKAETKGRPQYGGRRRLGRSDVPKEEFCYYFFICVIKFILFSLIFIIALIDMDGQWVGAGISGYGQQTDEAQLSMAAAISGGVIFFDERRPDGELDMDNLIWQYPKVGWRVYV